jgi:hypothetical protein
VSSIKSDAPICLLPQLEKILRCGEHELGQSRQSAGDVVASKDQGWVKNFKKSLGWALDEQQVRKSCIYIERMKASLLMTLTLTGR